MAGPKFKQSFGCYQAGVHCKEYPISPTMFSLALSRDIVSSLVGWGVIF